ncbi:hypothetical protein [Vibrio sp. SCSIO 43137]|uniref:hypothetical protein n=1 Tax=Vibrio sp. SCSIO 43137 TaxID=3021011 RepID=UPI0023072584|nr:hypothetical protein [Vibrio sp. SCSIO 43137]WCE31116.1 hypothetical protein PK654_07580 [Vibrio sp. SCSIO 43137]
MFGKLKKYLKQRSTWQGLSTLALTLGYVAGEAATGGLMGAAIAAAGSVSGLVETFSDDSKAAA